MYCSVSLTGIDLRPIRANVLLKCIVLLILWLQVVDCYSIPNIISRLYFLSICFT